MSASTYWRLLWARYWYQSFSPHSNCARGHHTISQMRKLRPRKARDLPKVSQLGSGQVSLKPGQSGCRSHSSNHSPNYLSKCRRWWSRCQIHSLHLKHMFGTWDWVAAIPSASVGKTVFVSLQKKGSILLLDNSFSPQKFLSQHGSQPKSNLLNCLKNVHGFSYMKRQGEKKP